MIGCSYISVFIAGTSTTGFVGFQVVPFFLKRQALKIFVTKLSAIPFENFASVFAERGATKNTFAISRRSI